MRLKEFEIFEAATAGATSSGNIAAVVNPHVAHNNKKPNKKWKPTDNALDMDVTLLASKEPSMIRRQIQEGSLYKNDELVEFKARNEISKNIKDVFPNFGKIKKTPYLDPEYTGQAASSFDELMKQRSKDNAIVNTEKSKRQTAKAAGYDAIMKGKDVGKIAKGEEKTPRPARKAAPGRPSAKMPEFTGRKTMPYTPRPDLKANAGMKDRDYKTSPGTGPVRKISKAPRGFEYDPDAGKNRDPGFTDRAPDPWGGKNLDPGFSDNVWTRRLDKKLKKQLGGRKPL